MKKSSSVSRCAVSAATRPPACTTARTAASACASSSNDQTIRSPSRATSACARNGEGRIDPDHARGEQRVELPDVTQLAADDNSDAIAERLDVGEDVDRE